nr:N-acetyltransferase [Acinetobacter sp. Marseille-Q1620]
MLNLKIRRLETQDAEDYRKIRLAALAQAPEMFGASYSAELEKNLDFFIQIISNSAVFGAFQNEQIVGLAVFKQGEGEKDRHKAYLYSFYVDSNYQRKGIADQLLRVVVEYGKQHVEQILLTVVDDNFPAIHLYEKHGFQVYGIEPLALKKGTVYKNEVLMILFLKTNPVLEIIHQNKTG